MPIDRNKLLRYKVLDTCLRDTSRTYRVDDLLACINAELDRCDQKRVSKRTVQLDLQTMQCEPYNAEFDDGLLAQHCYRYVDTECKVGLFEMLPPDRDALEKSISVLRQYVSSIEGQNPQWQWMLTALQAVAGGRELLSMEQYVSFENNNVFAGNAHFATLVESIINHCPLSVRYRPYGKEAVQLHIHPYHLKQFNSRWFLFCAVDGREGMSNLALDRIHDIRRWKCEFVPVEVDFTTWFDGMIGVSRNEDMPIEQITLRVANSRYPYVETKPFSEHQRIVRRDEQGVTITFPMLVNNELVAELLSFGPDIEVLRPQSLRARLADATRQMNVIYGQ